MLFTILLYYILRQFSMSIYLFFINCILTQFQIRMCKTPEYWKVKKISLAKNGFKWPLTRVDHPGLEGFSSTIDVGYNEGKWPE